jgi:folylpolyglutamate synthase/dihydropteroate synthase
MVPPDELAAAAQRIGVPAQVADSVDEALDRAIAAADVEDLILVTGSLYVVGAARTALSRKPQVAGGH